MSSTGDVTGSLILTASGRYVDPMALRVDDVRFSDIAHALSNLCRFTGHTRRFYSVAEHSVRVSRRVAELGGTHLEVLAGLLHDSSEAYLVDLPRPVKHHTELGRLYREAERSCQAVVYRAYALPETTPEVVKQADLELLATERRDLMPATTEEWPILADVAALPATIAPWTPAQAHGMFTMRGYSLFRSVYACTVDESAGLAENHA